MITSDTLGALKDEELRWVINQSQELLKKRDANRKAKALSDARAMQAKAQSEPRTLLESVGLSLQNLKRQGKRENGQEVVIQSGICISTPDR